MEERRLIRLSGWGQRRGRVRGFLMIAVTFTIFYVLFTRIDVRRTFSLLETIPLPIWIAAFLITLSFPLMSALRWHLILRAMGHDVGVPRCLLIIVGIWPLSAISPSKAGDFLKAFSLRAGIKSIVVAGSVVTERALDVLALAGLALVGGFAFENHVIVLVGATVVLVSSAILIVAAADVRLPVAEKLGHSLRDLMSSMRALAGYRSTLAAVVGLTFANWFASILQTALLFHGVGADVPLGFVVTALPVAIFAGLVPVTFGGMGTRDAAMVALFGAYAANSEILAVSLLYSFFGYWLLSVLGLPFLRKALSV